VVINNYSGAQVSAITQPDGTLEIEMRAADMARTMIAADIARGDGRVARAIQDTYGVTRTRR
jgi:hypothetical protein